MRPDLTSVGLLDDYMSISYRHYSPSASDVWTLFDVISNMSQTCRISFQHTRYPERIIFGCVGPHECCHGNMEEMLLKLSVIKKKTKNKRTFLFVCFIQRSTKDFIYNVKMSVSIPFELIFDNIMYIAMHYVALTVSQSLSLLSAKVGHKCSDIRI